MSVISKVGFVVVLLTLLPSVVITAQQDINALPGKLQRYTVERGDTVILVRLRTINVYPPEIFKNKSEEKRYNELVMNVKRMLPWAKFVYSSLLETCELMEHLPNDKARTRHLKQMEKDIWAQYKPVLKTFTFTQVKLLIRLIDRECNQSSYDLIKAFLGDFSAGFWNSLGSLFGMPLNSDWDPQGKDAQLERICRQVEQGLL